ncbi:tetratricopeptide repeat protein [Sorangium sp. So ce1335]|uniref:tetratricopeptide repeat protein n=1 Tax=Sorangium sp. So ce1335 TaxID=3133335 RepID=UPI003F627858
MKDDVLREAARALREEAGASRARRDETRARVMRSLKAQRARRLTTVRVAVPLAAVLVGSAAWASAARWFPDAWNDLASQLGLSVADPPDAPPAPPMSRALPSPRRAAEADAPAPPPPEPEAPAPPPPEPSSVAELAPPAPLPAPPLSPSAPPESAPAPRRAPVVAVAPRARSSSSAPVAASPAKPAQPPADDPQAIQRPPAGPDADALYQAAHRAHFVDRNPSAALAAWNDYLAAAPRGRFAVEAQYNRALCLVRLGRTDEARRALEPFAQGAFGGYRQTESRSLLEAMSNAGP